MDPIDWADVALAGFVCMGVSMLVLPNLSRAWRAGWAQLSIAFCFIPAAMLGHALARIGPEKLAAKPWLYFMQSGGLALAFVIPALWLSHLRLGVARRETIRDSLGFLAAYLAMGAVFWLRA